MKKYHVAVLGATGAVGRAMLTALEECGFPVGKLTLLASHRSAGTALEFAGLPHPVQAVSPESFTGVDIALFSPGGSVSREYAPIAVAQGAVVIDNSSAFRMDTDVPLVVPEVNPHAVRRHKGIIANPNCSTIQMVVALKPIHDAVRIRRVVVSTYQSVSGAGNKAMEELKEQTAAVLQGSQTKPHYFPHPIAFNAIPHIDTFLENGYTREEMKMVHETHKIMEDYNILVSPTTVRIPVLVGHSEAINIETEKPITPAEARAIWGQAPGVAVLDDPAHNVYPLPVTAAGSDLVYVGRIRSDTTVRHGLNFWIVADNLRKGAATNTVQIAQLLVKEGLV
jgi:aspartate-semialdehyde dehydrogenase